MPRCPFCRADTEDLGTHYGRECPAVLAALGPDDPRRYNIRSESDYPQPGEWARRGKKGRALSLAEIRARDRQSHRRRYHAGARL